MSNKKYMTGDRVISLSHPVAGEDFRSQPTGTFGSVRIDQTEGNLVCVDWECGLMNWVDENSISRDDSFALINFSCSSGRGFNPTSVKEYRMYAAFGMADLLQKGICPTWIMQMAVTDAFRKNLQGKHVESLRRCLSAYEKCSPYRCTPEYDNLIELD